MKKPIVLRGLISEEPHFKNELNKQSPEFQCALISFLNQKSQALLESYQFEAKIAHKISTLNYKNHYITCYIEKDKITLLRFDKANLTQQYNSINSIMSEVICTESHFEQGFEKLSPALQDSLIYFIHGKSYSILKCYQNTTNVSHNHHRDYLTLNYNNYLITYIVEESKIILLRLDRIDYVPLYKSIDKIIGERDKKNKKFAIWLTLISIIFAIFISYSFYKLSRNDENIRKKHKAIPREIGKRSMIKQKKYLI